MHFPSASIVSSLYASKTGGVRNKRTLTRSNVVEMQFFDRKMTIMKYNAQTLLSILQIVRQVPILVNDPRQVNNNFTDRKHNFSVERVREGVLCDRGVYVVHMVVYSVFLRYQPFPFNY